MKIINSKIYIYIYTLLVCLVVCVCLYPINVKKTEPIGPKFCWTSRDPMQERFMDDRIFKNLPPKKFQFCNLKNVQVILILVANIFCTKYSPFSCICSTNCGQVQNYEIKMRAAQRQSTFRVTRYLQSSVFESRRYLKLFI